MKLTYFQLEAALKKKISPLYLLSGDEPLLKQDALRWIRKAAKEAGFSERTRLIYSSDQHEKIYTFLHARPLLAEKCLLEIDFTGTKLDKTMAAMLTDYANRPLPEYLVLIHMGKIDSKITQTNWYKAIEKAGVVTTLWPITREQLPQWIAHRGQKYGLHILPEATALLTDHAEGNLTVAAQALEKLYLLQPAEPINVTIMQTVLAGNSHFTIFDFTHALITGRIPHALRILESLQHDGTEPALILWAIMRELRMITGQGSNSISSSQNIKLQKQQTAVRHFFSQHTLDDCRQYMARALEIDYIIKGAMPENVWCVLRLFCLRFG